MFSFLLIHVVMIFVIFCYDLSPYFLKGMFEISSREFRLFEENVKG